MDIDPEDVPYAGPIKVPQSRVLLQTSHEALREFAMYLELIRNSLQNVLVDINKYVEQRDLIKSDVFWRSFIMKAIDSGKIEPQLWDFKKTLDMWHIKRGQEKDKAERICLMIAIAQTDSPVSVKDKDERYTYPLRREAGFDRVDATELSRQKMHIKSTNFNFIRDLSDFVHDK